jgi:hypothetical protein
MFTTLLTFLAKSIPIPSSSHLCARSLPRPGRGVGVHPERLGAFSSPALSVVEGSPACPVQPVYHVTRREHIRRGNYVPNSPRIRTYGKQPPNPFGMRSFKTQDLKPFRMCSYEKAGEGDPSFFRSISHPSHASTSNSHGIIFFAHPHPLTPIESYSCKKQGGGVSFTLSRRPCASSPCATRRNAHNSNPFMDLLHTSLDTPGVGGLLLGERGPIFSRLPRNTGPKRRSRNSGHGIWVAEHGSRDTGRGTRVTASPSLSTP